MSNFPTNPHDTIQSLRREIELLRKERDELMAAIQSLADDALTAAENGYESLGVNHVIHHCRKAVAKHIESPK